MKWSVILTFVLRIIFYRDSKRQHLSIYQDYVKQFSRHLRLDGTNDKYQEIRNIKECGDLIQQELKLLTYISHSEIMKVYDVL